MPTSVGACLMHNVLFVIISDNPLFIIIGRHETKIRLTQMIIILLIEADHINSISHIFIPGVTVGLGAKQGVHTR